MKLVIVESPAKAKTIERFLGPEYKVAASYGHIRDLPSSAAEIPARLRDKSWSRLAVDVEKDFQPVYVVPVESRKRVSELKRMIKRADELLLATDEDREGESISWHLLEVLDPEIPVRRITFHEITQRAISRALESPREVDQKLVKAQEARRVLDRLFGYSLSPVLWKRVRTKLSAGRVQSAALRLIVEREEERQAFESTVYWDVLASLRGGGIDFEARLVAVGDRRVASSRDFDSTTGQLQNPDAVVVLDEAAARRVAEGVQSDEALPWVVSSAERTATKQRPPPPFTTSTLQQAASSRLRMSPKRTMRVAQTLYEGVDLGDGDRQGLITYMRTDSVTLSDEMIDATARYVKAEFGDRYHQGPRRYQTKARNAQEAHEAIRPTDVTRTPDQVERYVDREELALYRLIWERAVASQMADAELDRTTADLTATVDGEEHRFRATGSVLRFPGFLRVSGGQREDTLIPPLEEGALIRWSDADSDGAGPAALVGLDPQSHETRPPPRYTEASLVKKLEEEGIGRPSTYTPTISTIQDRQYAVKRGSQLVPTYVGMAVLRLLRKHFGHYVDLKFTAAMEDRLDDIASGTVDATEFLSEFYRGDGSDDPGLEQAIERELPRIEYPQIPVGRDPETGQPLFVRIGRNSIFVQRGEGDDGDRATVPMDVLIDELTPLKANEFLQARERGDEPLGRDDLTGEDIFLKIGPYGPYLQLGDAQEGPKPKRVSLPKGVEAEDVTLDMARRLLSLPREIGVDPETGDTVTAGLGRYGPYVERAGTFRSIDSVDRIFEVGLEEAVELINTKRKGRTRTVLRELGEHPESGKELQLLEGRYGPYVSDGKLNASIPKGQDPASVTMGEAVELLQKAAARKKSKGGRRKSRAS